MTAADPIAWGVAPGTGDSGAAGDASARGAKGPAGENGTSQLEDALRLLADLAIALGAAENLDQGIDALLHRICATTHWALAQAWVPTPDGASLTCSPAWCACADNAVLRPFRAASEVLRIPLGTAGSTGPSSPRAPGEVEPEEPVTRAWRTKQPVWTPALPAGGAPHGSGAGTSGLVAVLAAPVLAGDEVVAVLQFCLAERHTEDDAFAQIIAAAAARLGSVLARKRHDAAHARPLPAPQHGELGQTASAAGTPTQTAALESLFQALVESGPDAVVITDSEGRIVLVNRQTEVLFGYRRDELVGQPVEHLLPERLREAHVRHRARYAAAPRARAIGEGQTLLARRKDGSEVPVDISLSPVETASGVVIKTAIRDITWWRDIEQQREEFLSSVTHDLRAPAAAIKASVGVVLANEPADLPVPLHRMLVNIDISADRMEQLAADLLDLARLRAGDTPFETVRCDLRTVARRAAQQIEPLAQARDQHLELDLPATPVWAPVDAQRLERALGNLLSNAHKYGRTGGRIQLALEHRRRPAAGGGRATDGGAADGEAVLTVMDDGPGIAPEDQAHIFDRFFRAPASAGHVTGSGLGLAIARAIAERHGGRLWVDSVLGQGATFSLAVPMNAAAQVAPPPGPRPPWAAVTGREDDRAVAPSRKDRVAELDRHLWQLRERQQRRLRAEGVALRAQGLHLRQFGRNLREHTGAGRLGRAALAAWVDALTVYHRQISDWNARMAAYQRRRIGPAGH